MLIVKIYIGKDTGKFSSSDIGGDIKFSIGNSILLQIEKNKYVFVEGSIYEFTTNDEIIKYFSLIGRNDVPYPIALGKENVYFMLDEFYIPKKYFPTKMKEFEFEDAYQLYFKTLYDNDENKKISKEFKTYKLKNYKVLDMI